jgi:transcriptional regulator with PAS, ATPase and Fis domain/Tfp pilus assembly protein PilF/nucleoside-triphosphatase THEP1
LLTGNLEKVKKGIAKKIENEGGMNSVVGNVLSEYITRDSQLIEEILSGMGSENSIVEVTGASGTGKSFIFEKLNHVLKNKQMKYKVMIPRVRGGNQFYDFVQLLTGMEESEYREIISKSQEYEIKNRYDFYYYFTRQIENSQIETEIIVIYESSYLDEYTRDFIQFLINYLTKTNIKFIIFSGELHFPDGYNISMAAPTKEDIANILSNLAAKSDGDYVRDAEVIEHVSEQNYYSIQYILENYFTSSDVLQLDQMIDHKITIESIYQETFSKLNATELELLLYIYLLDTHAERKHLNELSGRKAIKALKTLDAEHLTIQIGDYFYVRKVEPLRSYFNDLEQKEQHRLISQIKEFSENEVCNEFLDRDAETQNQCISYLDLICDQENLLRCNNLLLEHLEDGPAKVEVLNRISQVKKETREINEAIEILRSSLKLAQSLDLPIYWIIHELADCLSINTNYSFALEVIKKYSPDKIEDYWHWKIILLKARLFMQLEDFEEAIKIVEEAYSVTSKIDNHKQSMQMRADTRKLKGLIYYYDNDYLKAQSMFEDALRLYKNADDIGGMAAAYNNLGVLAMSQGDWKETEKLYLESLKFEEQRYNLNGISFVYNNLGYLFDEKGDYEKSLFYLQKAYEIQLLLNDRYTVANILINIGVNHMDNGQYQLAANSFQEALQVSFKFNYYRLEIASLDNLGVCYFRWGDWTKAIKYYNDAIKKSREANFFEGLCQSYNNIGELYMRRGELDLAIDFYSQAKELLPKFNDDFQKADLFGNLGQALTMLNKFSEAYSYLVKSYEFFKTINQKDKIIEGALGHALYFIRSSNLESADYYLEYAMTLAKELDDEFRMGQCYYRMASLHENDPDLARQELSKALEFFRMKNKNFELTQANFEYARLIADKGEWEQALQILEENKTMVKKFGAIKFLEENDILIQEIRGKFKDQMQESKHQETLLNQFYEITQSLNNIHNIETILQIAINKIVEFAEADGGVLAFYYNQRVKNNWDYLFYNGYSASEKDHDILLEVINGTYDLNEGMNHKQPHFAPSYNNIISYPLTVRNERKGVIMLFTRYETRYFSEKMVNLVSALCNQIVVIVENISIAILQRSHASIREELAQNSEFPEIIGKSEGIQKIFRLIDKIKDTPTTVLLEGDSGTGKELIARAIHFSSNRRNKRFVAQYCGALTETLLESELFGHVKGAFTGASYDKKGLFEIANGGTFFLDEIADISLSTQAKLLRFLQEGEIKRVGSTITEKINVRVVCATNVSLSERVQTGEFRQDLYYRLNVIRIQVPSLRERKTDITLLSVHFLDKYCKRIGKRISGISGEALRYLSQYNWPGNIRQLENEVERAVTLSEDDSPINAIDLSPEVYHYQENAETLNLLEDNSLKAQVERLEREVISSALEDTGGNQTQAAKKLGMSRQGLIKKIQRYNVAKLDAQAKE